MPNGGILGIETFNAPCPPDAQSQVDGEALRVSDTGIGMDESVRSRMFEPFFTTKQESGGTGLGLATVFGIVKQSGGHIAVESKLGKGSTFTLYFPKAHAFEIGGQRDARERKESTTGSETILLIEDLSELRDMMATTLRTKGYKVLQARDGVDAVNVAASHFAPIDLILTDVVMPKLNGPEAVREIRMRRPGVKAIYITGYADQSVVDKGPASNAITVEKPIRPDALIAKIREVLDQDQTKNRIAS
jgi:two-component system, cell cycle sensor histidine kinase and response regulator CckA